MFLRCAVRRNANQESAGLQPQQRLNKYHAQRSTADSSRYAELAGRSFPSGLERDRAVELVLLQRSGVISELEFQPRVFLTEERIAYHPDFSYHEGSGRLVYEEAKGFETERWIILKRLWASYGPAPLYVMRRSRNGRIKLTETILPRH